MSPPTELLPDPLPAEPLAVVNRWLAESWQLKQQPNPNAMVLATTTPEGHPSARVVLCKEIVPEPGYLVFYTNYLSRKGQQLTRNPRAAAVMHWDHLHRQVRVEGPIVRAPEADSDAYFASRPWQSRLGAWASAQSEPIATRAELHAALAKTAKRFGAPMPGTMDDTDVEIPRPPHWGGFHLWADSVELWVEGTARIHDRARWTRSLVVRAGGFDAGAWAVTRLQP
ncbi:MAG TPA: pyridoxamine 5'-phosphate oxidase [Steroidobacteraceae bacterium]|nr:pyridoxamine 5'-phosphate oxidase [Steroidobacteraceae bacterium]